MASRSRGSQKELSDLELQNIVQELEIGTPILAYRVVGSRVELQLLGGAQVEYTLADPLPPLKQLNRAELLALAKEHDIRGRTSMTKAQLIQALEGTRNS